MFQLPVKLPISFTASHGHWIEVTSPNDGSLVATVQEASANDVEQLVKVTKDIQSRMKSLRPYERAEFLRIVAGELRLNREAMATVIATEGGKPLKDSLVEVERAATTLELCAEEALRLIGETIPLERTALGKDHLAFTIRESIGAVLAISAFNHPLNLLAHQVGCAIAAGCAVVVKPAPSTPVSASILRELFLKAGLFPEAMRVVHAAVPLVRELAASPVFDYVSFIGSAKVGWDLRRIIAHGTRLALEHGGIAPAIVAEDANLEEAASALVKGAFYHAGQVCISTQRVFVQKPVFHKFLTLFREKTLKLKTGPATSPETDVGPLIRSAEVTRILSWIDEALKLGASLECGKNISGNYQQYLAPTILSEVPRNALLMKEEVFGPVVCVNSFDDEAELLTYLNESEYVFEAALFTTNLQRSLHFARELSTMTLVINNHSAFRVDQMPFGGYKKSGLGMGGVKYAIDEMTQLKQIIMKM